MANQSKTEEPKITEGETKTTTAAVESHEDDNKGTGPFRIYHVEGGKLYNGKLKFKTKEEGEQYLLDRGFTQHTPNNVAIDKSFIGPTTGNQVYVSRLPETDPDNSN